MATITSLGIGTAGLDSNSIVSKLVDLEKAPLKTLQAAATIDKAQITAFGKIQSEFSALADAAKAMASASSWQARTASSSNTSAATISVTSTANTGAFTLDVDALAMAQAVSSTTIAQGTAVGAGTLTFQLGTWTGTGSSATFAAGSSSAVSVTVSATDTVATIAAAINKAGAGVTATVFNDGTNDRLLLSSSSTGAATGFRVQATDTNGTAITDNTGLSRVAFDPQTGAFGAAAASIPVQYGQDAKARINGLAVTSSTNTLANNLPGVTINLLATTTTNYGTSSETKSPATLSVSQDVTGVVKNIQAFVTAYNTLWSDLQSGTAYNASTQTPSLFQGDGSIVGLESILSSMVGSISNGSSAYNRLSDIGVQVQTDGTLGIDTTKLGAAANNGTELQKLFTTDNKNAATNGFALKFANFASGAIASGGLVATKATALQTVLDNNGKEQDKVNAQATALQTRLQAQYTALDAKMSTLSALSSYVSQQITTWNKNTN